MPIRYVIFGGEALGPGRLKEWKAKYPGTRLINMYGITETTVHVTFKEIGDGGIEENISNIGSSIPTLSTYVMDRHLNLQPIGIAGELYVGGEGLGRGYLNRPELTAEKFCLRRPGGTLFEKTAPPGPPRKNFLFEGSINDHWQSCKHAAIRPYSHAPLQLIPHHSPHSLYLSYSPIYRTGDLARWLSDGNIEFLGRNDQQVKIRGYRIETGEIEYRLLKLNLNNIKIKEALVMAAEGKDGDKKLCAYIVSDIQPEVSDIRKSLAAELPDYMIPSFFLQIDKIPLTPTGKIDPKALPEPEQVIEAAYVAPENSTQEQIKKIWQETLDLEKIGIYDNFFAIGGHSIKGIQVLNHIQKEFNVEIPLVKIFEIPTIKGLAEYIAEAAAPIMGENKLLLLNQKKDSPNHFFFVHDGRGEVDGYVEFCSHLTNDFNLWGIPADKL